MTIGLEIQSPMYMEKNKKALRSLREHLEEWGSAIYIGQNLLISDLNFWYNC